MQALLAYSSIMLPILVKSLEKQDNPFATGTVPVAIHDGVARVASIIRWESDQKPKMMKFNEKKPFLIV